MNSKQENMEKLVQAIQDSLENEPELWHISPCTIHHKGSRFSGTEFWIIDGFLAYNGRTTEDIFTVDQQTRLLRSFRVTESKVCNSTQQRLVDSLEDVREVEGYFSRNNFCKDLSEVLKKYGVKSINMFAEGFFTDERCEMKTSSEDIVLTKHQIERLL